MEQDGMYDEDDTDVDMDDDGRAKQGKESKKKRVGVDDDEPPLEGYQRWALLYEVLSSKADLDER